jgi:nucleoid-associated protein YgaU
MDRAAAVITASSGLALLATAPAPRRAVGTLAAATSSADPLAPLVAALALTAWALVGWLLVLALATSMARRPGRTGRVANGVSRRIAPAGVRRLVELTLGLSVAVGSLGASPASAGTALPPAPTAATAVRITGTADAATGLDWPIPPTGSAEPIRDAQPALDWDPDPAAQSTPAAQPVVVQPGDSLWAITAEHLPAAATDAQIAHAWPSWWSANRAAVGSDPDLIHPGLRLIPPAQH